MTTTPTAVRFPPNKRWKWKPAALTLVLAGAGVLGLAPRIQSWWKARQEARRELVLRQEIGRLCTGAADDNRRTVAAARARIAELTWDPPWRPAAVRDTVEELTSLGNTGAIVWRTAKDKCRGTASADDLTRAIVGRHLGDPCRCLGTRVAAEVANLNTRLAERHTRLQADLLQAVDQAYPEPAPGQAGMMLTADLAGQGDRAQARAVQEGLSGAMVTASAVGLAEVSLRRVSSRFAARSVATLPIAALDGPLPIGDAVCVGLDLCFGVQAISELYEAVCQIPDQMRAGLNQAVRSYAARLNTEATGAIGTLQTRYEQANQQLADNLVRELGKNSKETTP